MMKDLPLSKVYQLFERGPVVLLTTALKGRANVTTSTGDKGHFDMGYHGYRLMARMPCSWYRAPTVTPSGKAAFSRPSCSGVNATFNTPTFSSK